MSNYKNVESAYPDLPEYIDIFTPILERLESNPSTNQEDLNYIRALAEEYRKSCGDLPYNRVKMFIPTIPKKEIEKSEQKGWYSYLVDKASEYISLCSCGSLENENKIKNKLE